MCKSSEKSGFRFMVGVSVRVRVSCRSTVSADSADASGGSRG